METCPTKRIVGANGEPVIINESDFDPKVHKEWHEPKAKGDDDADDGKHNKKGK